MSDYFPDPDSLWSGTPLGRLARKDDRPTSKAAGAVAEQEFAATHEGKILEALAIGGPGTKDQIAARCGLSEQQVIRRMSRLEAERKVVAIGEDSSPSGCRETVWGRAACHGR